MSFYTALTGLKGAQQDISTTSNNIANVGSTGFKKSRTEFGDIFGTTPLQTNVVGAGTATKSITQIRGNPFGEEAKFVTPKSVVTIHS